MLRISPLLFSGVAAVALLFSAAQAAEQQTTLADLGQRLKLDPAQISVSGVSSGGFMAHQFHVAHSADIVGSGVIAGGPYYCTKGSVISGLTECTAFLADGMCQGYEQCKEVAYVGPELAPPGQAASEKAMAMAKQSVDATLGVGQTFNIDDPAGMIGDKVVILHGAKDSLLRVGVSDALYQYFPLLYQRRGKPLPEGTVVYLKELPAPHAVVTDNHAGLDPTLGQINSCERFGSPFVNVCGKDDCAKGCEQACQGSAPAEACNASCGVSCGIALDNAGRILQHIHGPLQPRPDAGVVGVTQYDPLRWPTVSHDCKSGDVTDSRCQWLQERLMAFRQKEVFGDSDLTTLDAVMAGKGYVFVPPQCLDGETSCKLHVAFHGCRQGYGFTGIEPDGQPVKKALYGARKTEVEKQLRGWTYFVENAGYNEWADTNGIVVLYPQATTRTLAEMQHINPEGCWDFWAYTDQKFNTKDGPQVAGVWRMIEALVPKLAEGQQHTALQPKAR
jgi:poly(3-hydroxybutyrate) depolymerase